MPRTTKEKTKKEDEKNIVSKTKSQIKTASKKTSEKSAEKKASTKKTTSKKSAEKKENPKKASSSKKKSVSSKNSTAVKKSASTKKNKKLEKSENFISEYYDLPYKYNKTVVKILAQTPKKLFVYWEISDDDRNSYLENFGEHFFYDTKPVLIIHNLTMNYSFEIDINDFANSWYININDTDCLYDVELGRRPITFNEKIQTPYIHISSSNNLQTPNNHILFENINQNTVLDFKNTKTKEITQKSIVNLSFFTINSTKIYGKAFYDFYTKLYSENILKELADTKLNNPSSGAISAFK